MDPATIVTGVVSVLTPYVSKGAKEFLSVAGEAGYQKARALLGKLKARWAGDAEASGALENFKNKPERYETVLKAILIEKLSENPDLAAELSDLLREMGPVLTVLQEADLAQGMTGIEAADMNSGKARVTQRVGRAEGVVGIKLDRIG